VGVGMRSAVRHVGVVLALVVAVLAAARCGSTQPTSVPVDTQNRFDDAIRVSFERFLDAVRRGNLDEFCGLIWLTRSGTWTVPHDVSPQATSRGIKEIARFTRVCSHVQHAASALGQYELIYGGASVSRVVRLTPSTGLLRLRLTARPANAGYRRSWAVRYALIGGAWGC
jgi:hypothetical protein